MNDKEETLDLYEAANFLKMHWQTLRRKVICGEIPGVKLSKRWVFLKSDLVNYIQSQYSPRCSPRLQVQNMGETQCCTTDQTQNSTGVDLPHQMELKYEEALKPLTKRRPKNTKQD